MELNVVENAKVKIPFLAESKVWVGGEDARSGEVAGEDRKKVGLREGRGLNRIRNVKEKATLQRMVVVLVKANNVAAIRAERRGRERVFESVQSNAFARKLVADDVTDFLAELQNYFVNGEKNAAFDAENLSAIVLKLDAVDVVGKILFGERHIHLEMREIGLVDHHHLFVVVHVDQVGGRTQI